MKIVFLSFYSGMVERGVETFVDALASRLASQHEVTIFQASKNRKTVLYTQSIIPQTIQWPEVNPNSWIRKMMMDYYSRQIARFTLRVWKYLKVTQPDIIIPTNGGWQTWLIKSFCNRYGSKLVISGQAGLGWDEKWNLQMKPDLFVALSQRNEKWARGYAPNQNMVVIPNGVDLEKFKVQSSKFKVEKEKIIKQLSRPIIMCVAGPEKYKRVEATIQAVAKLSQGSLLVVGGSLETKQMGKQLLDTRFAQMKIDHDRMPQVYAQADVFTLVSEASEAFGIAYLEALASNLPVVASDDELRHEIIGKAGLYIEDPWDSLAYAQKLQFALDKDWKQIPRKRAHRFSWDSIALQYDQAFQSL